MKAMIEDTRAAEIQRDLLSRRWHNEGKAGGALVLGIVAFDAAIAVNQIDYDDGYTLFSPFGSFEVLCACALDPWHAMVFDSADLVPEHWW